MPRLGNEGASRIILIALAAIAIVAIVVVAAIAMGLMGNLFSNGGSSSDTTHPMISIQTPTSDPVYFTTQNSTLVGGSASDDVGVTRVNWSNDRGGFGTAAGTTSWTATVPLNPGPNNITVIARDAANNQWRDTITITYITSDMQSPSITITSPTSEPTFSTSSSSVVLSGTASDYVGVTSVTWSNDRGGSGTASGTTSWSISSISIYTGSNFITVTAHNAAGNASSDSITVVYDNQAPTVTITSPTSDPAYSTVSFTIALGGMASDNVGVIGVTWSNDQGGSGSAVMSGTNWSISPISLVPGVNTITISASDAAGNTPGNDTISVTCTPPDTQSPTITIINPTSDLNYQSSSSPIALSGTSSDNVGVTSVTWSNDRGGSGTASGTTSWSVPSIALVSGVNIITVSSFDAAGNSPGTDTIIINYAPPITDIQLSGHGDDITQSFVLTTGVAIFQMSHVGSSNFAIWLVTQGGVEEELLANEIGSYQGSTLVGVTTSYSGDVVPGTYYLEVTADGDWTVTISQPRPSSAPGLPQTITGISDKASSAFTLTEGAIKFQMSYTGSSNFIVILYNEDGEWVDLLANEIGDYTGTTSVGVTSTGIYYLSVIGIGSWSVAISHL